MGQIEEYTFLSKKHSTSPDGFLYLSYLALINNNSVNLIYQEKGATDFFPGEREPSINLITRENGKSEVMSILADHNIMNDYNLVPVYSCQLSENRLLLMFHNKNYGKKKHRYATLTFN